MVNARIVFAEMPVRNLISWNAMVVGYVKVVIWIRLEVYLPDAFTMTAVISALAQLGRPELTNWINNLVRHEDIKRNERVLTAVADMHAKFGNIEEACKLFDEICKPDLYAFSALITGLASNGHGIKALEVFRNMLVAKIEPNAYKIEPNADHYACIVDMLGSAGRLEQAFKMLQSLSLGPYPGALGSLLAACRIYNNVEIAELVAKELFTFEPENTGNYKLLSDIYAAREQWDTAASMQRAIKEKINTKLPGCSMLDSN